MLYFSSLLKTDLKYSSSAKNLFPILSNCGEKFTLFDGAKDIWARDYMPVKTKSGKYLSFRYEPSYLDGFPELRTDFRRDIAPNFAIKNLVYSEINLDGGNAVFSPSKETVVISDRVFTENLKYSSAELVQELEKLLEARVIIIPSLRLDMTGHADGMVRFVDENTAIGNASRSLFGLEAHIKTALLNHGIEVIDFPYFDSKGDSAVGCYLNFLETEQAIFLPVFDVETDNIVLDTAKSIFDKEIIPVNINEIAVKGGLLNCISWED
jgi:agmatine deiminase